MENCPQKAIPGPLVSNLTRPLPCEPLQEAWKSRSIRWRKEMEVQWGYRSTPWFHSSFLGLSHAVLSVLYHYISSARYPTTSRLFLHTASLPTLNIFIILLCVADEVLWLGFHYWAECRRPDGERTEEKEIRVSNSVREPIHSARLMAAKLSTALINTHLS